MKGKTNHASYVAWIGQGSYENSLNDYLYNAGCVFYVRTTGPQTLMQLETSNNIYGRTVNPWNRNLTCGGSSGGEGALVGFRGSVWVSLDLLNQPTRPLVDQVSRAWEETLAAASGRQPATTASMASSQQPNGSRCKA